MGSPNSETRRKALSDFYSAAHRQGDVYACTTASLPFLFALADDPAAPDCASVVDLLLGIGRESVDRDDDIRFEPGVVGGSAMPMKLQPMGQIRGAVTLADRVG